MEGVYFSGLEVRFVRRRTLKLAVTLRFGVSYGGKTCGRRRGEGGILRDSDVANLPAVYELFERLPGRIGIIAEFQIYFSGRLVNRDRPCASEIDVSSAKGTSLARVGHAYSG